MSGSNGRESEGGPAMNGSASRRTFDETRGASTQMQEAVENARRFARPGHFRPDLFYRLNIPHLSLPPLRERREDIPLLANEFLRFRIAVLLAGGARPATGNGSTGPPTGFTPNAIEKMMAYGWPGNVR